MGPMFAAIHTDSEQLFLKEMVWFSYAIALGTAIPSEALSDIRPLGALHAQSAAVIPLSILPKKRLPRINPRAMVADNFK